MNAVQPAVLVVTKDAASRGGVATYFNLFFRKFEAHQLRLERFDIGSRSRDYYSRRQRLFAYCLEYARDASRFVWLLLRRWDIRIVHLNPSLIPVPLFRDGLLLVLSKLCRRKVVVFVRGWRDDIAIGICRSPWRRRLFTGVFGRADCIIVLAEDFRTQLRSVGITDSKIVVSRTMFDGDLIQPKPMSDDTTIRFLYLSRISREKGAFEVVEAAGMLIGQGLSFRIAFHGHGATADTVTELKGRAMALGVHDVIDWGGFIEGRKKYEAYATANVYLLPSHHEGCPNSVLEAMGAGCYIICTGAGAMKEVVQDGVNGSIVAIGDAADLAGRMRYAIENREAIQTLGRANRDYAFRSFESRPIIRQVAAIYESLCNEGRGQDDTVQEACEAPHRQVGKP